jgi:hypothetical protein
MCVNTEIVRIGEFVECLSFICVFHIAIRCKRMASCNLLLHQVNLYISFSIFPVVRTPVFVIYEATRMSKWIENYRILRRSMFSTYDTLLRSSLHPELFKRNYNALHPVFLAIRTRGCAAVH